MKSLVYVDRSTVRPGKADELEAAARRLVAHVENSDHRARSYGIYFSDDRSTMTVVHAHPDSDSLEQLIAVIAPMLAPFRELLELRSIDVYGSPSEKVVGQLRDKVDLLGGTVTIHRPIAMIEGPTLT
jgi:hypothetical protein